MKKILDEISNLSLKHISFLYKTKKISKISYLHSIHWSYVLSKIIRISTSINEEDYNIGISQLKKKYPLYLHNICMLYEVTINYPDIISGKLTIKKILFNNYNFDNIRNIYSKTPETIRYNNILSDMVVDSCNYGFSILELGSGIGTIASLIGNRISDKVTIYSYTDISQSLINYGKRMYSQYYQDKLNTFILDINKMNSFKFEQLYDIIFASDVLHNSTNILKTLNLINSSLKLGGVFIFNEIIQDSLYSNLIYGLTGEWWKFDIDSKEYISPVIEIDKWNKYLQASGFSDIKNYGYDAIFSHCIFYSRKEK